MILTLNPEHERMVNEELRAGRYSSAEEVIGCALEALREKDLGILLRGEKRDPKRAAARIRERRKGVTLGGLSIKDLVNEGRR
jgi:Arc/MetJ-type ribon-helix-helix transcriptional regulator